MIIRAWAGGRSPARPGHSSDFTTRPDDLGGRRRAGPGDPELDGTYSCGLLTSMRNRRSRLARRGGGSSKRCWTSLQAGGIRGGHEQAPRTLASERPDLVTYSSPCFLQPEGHRKLQSGSGRERWFCADSGGCDDRAVRPARGSDAAHRFGEHIDHLDFRKWLDDGRPVLYRVSRYRTDVAYGPLWSN